METASLTLAQREYEATAEFQAYLKAKRNWEEARDHAQRNQHSGSARGAEIIAYGKMAGLLEAARRTPEHKAAFGW